MKQVIFFLFVALTLVLSACGPEAECESSAQCSVINECFTPICQDGQCSTRAKQDCCGNNICEEGEDVCSCDKDCKFPDTANGKCEGKVQIENERRPGNFDDADYAQYYCGDEGCTAGVPSEEVQVVKLSSDHGSTTLKFQMTVSISKPYVITGGGIYDVRVDLFDYDEERVDKPIRITKIQIMSGSELLGEKSVNHQFSSIGGRFETSIDLDMALDELEDERYVTTKVYYEYEQISYDGTKETVRKSFERNHNKIPFVDPKKV